MSEQSELKRAVIYDLISGGQEIVFLNSEQEEEEERKQAKKEIHKPHATIRGFSFTTVKITTRA